jgi:hypothetical protein
MVEKIMFNNAKNLKWLIGGFIGLSLYYQKIVFPQMVLKQEVFGYDGNGGKMLKIITNLTDEEMARLKFVRRMQWHWKGSRKLEHGQDTIQDQEL